MYNNVFIDLDEPNNLVNKRANISWKFTFFIKLIKYINRTQYDSCGLTIRV